MLPTLDGVASKQTYEPMGTTPHREAAVGCRSRLAATVSGVSDGQNQFGEPEGEAARKELETAVSDAAALVDRSERVLSLIHI